MVAQPMPEPIKSAYLKATTSKEKAEALLDITRPSMADTKILEQQKALLEWFSKNQDELGANYTTLYIGTVFMFKDDANIALKMALPLLEKFEKRNDQYGIMRCYQLIGMCYSVIKSYDLSFSYLHKSIAIAEKYQYERFQSIIYNSAGVVYFESGQPIPALEYAQKALQLDIKNKDSIRLPVSLSTVGESYMEAKSYDLAMPFLRRSFNLFSKREHNTYSAVYIHNDLAQAYLGLKQPDSAMHYAYLAIKKSLRQDYKNERLRSYQYLIDIFTQTGKQDSLNKYYPLLIKTKDDIFDLGKLRSIENSNFAEQLRQREIEAEKLKAEEERRHVIQYAMIATGIITFFILFLLLSRTVIVNEKWISFLAILALLLVFEFINLLIHPFIGNLTHHSPILMLLCMVALASLLIPLHHKLEHFIKHKLTEKNKAIRLAAAKKTIEELE